MRPITTASLESERPPIPAREPATLARVCLAIAVSRDVDRARVVVIGERAFLSLEREGLEQPLGIVPRESGEAIVACLGVLAGASPSTGVEHLGRVDVAMGAGRGRVLVRLAQGPDGPEAELQRLDGGVEPWVPRPGPTGLPPTRLGAYAVAEELGRGGAGIVYRGVHQALQREAAIKLLDGPAVGRAEATLAFLREAQAASRIDHPSVVRVHDFGTAPDGRPYMVMERVRGPTLRQALAAAEGGVMEPARALRVGAGIAEALAEAHAADVIHCDIKPDNVFLMPDDRVKVVDFGAAQVRGADMRGFRLVGTPGYMAPERFLDGDTTPASDLYALGCLLYELLTGRLPFEDDDLLRLVDAHQRAHVPPIESPRGPIPEPLERVIHACLAKTPETRPESAARVARALREAGRG